MLAWIVALCLVATVIRARRRGIPWEIILAFPSQWFNWTFFGRDFTEPFSAFVGVQVRDGSNPVVVWRITGRLLDTVFLVKEKNHCAESVSRLERWKLERTTESSPR